MAGILLGQDATVWPNFIVLFLTIRWPFIPGCSGQVQTPASSRITNGCANVGRATPTPIPRCFRVTAINILPTPPFLAQIIYPHTTPLKIIQTTLSFWRRQSLLSKRAISHPLPPQNSGAVEFATRGNPSCPRHKERLTRRVCLRPALNNSPNPGGMQPTIQDGQRMPPKYAPAHIVVPGNAHRLLDPGALTPP